MIVLSHINTYRKKSYIIWKYISCVGSDEYHSRLNDKTLSSCSNSNSKNKYTASSINGKGCSIC